MLDLEQYGRIEIYTDVREITYENVADIVKDAMDSHQINANTIDYLIKFEAGKQPKFRKKKYRSDIDCWCVDNVANEISDFWINYGWGNPITLVRRDDNESSIPGEVVTEINRCYEAEGVRKTTQELGRYVEIGGNGYTYVDVNTDYEDGDSYFKLHSLNPRCTFIAYSSYYLDKRPMLAVTYSCDKQGQKTYTCISKYWQYELDNEYNHTANSGVKNVLEAIPVVEWIRATDRMGCFERQIPEMENLNLLISDFTNDVDQNTQAIWHGNDIQFPKDEEGNSIAPKTNEWLLTYTPKDGKQPFVKALAVEYDYQGMLNNIVTRRGLILQKAKVPSRNDNSGGSTGIAMSDATGWTQAEIEATRQDQLKEDSKMQEIKLVLKAIKLSPHVPEDSPLKKLRFTDLKPSIKRQKTYEMTTKMNAFATGVSHGINPTDMLSAINFFDDPQQVAENSKETLKAYQDSVFNGNNKPVGGEDEQKPNADRLQSDESDQIGNSPNVDGMKTE